MRINKADITQFACSEIQHHDVEFPYLLPIEPMGLHTGDVESLTSYICRQAEAMSERTLPFHSKLLKRYLSEEEIPHCRHIPPKVYHSCNGFNKYAQRALKALSLANEGSWDPEWLTFTPLRWICDRQGRGVLRSNMAWCKECWQEDIQNEQTPYVRLYWLSQQTKVCIHHDSRLAEYCPACGETKFIFSRLPMQWLCDHCGMELYKPDKKHIPENFTSQDAWVSMAIYQLLNRMQRDSFQIYPDTFAQAISNVLKTSKMSLESFCSYLNLDLAIFRRIVEEKGRLFFPVALDLCYRLEIPPDQFLFDRDVLTAPEVWNCIPKTIFTGGARLSTQERKRIQRALRRLLKKNPIPPVRVAHFARSQNVSKSALSYNFPDEYRELSRRYSKWEKDKFRAGHTQRLENICEAAFALAKQGIFPSKTRLEKLGFAKKSHTAREDVTIILEAFQTIYAALDEN